MDREDHPHNPPTRREQIDDGVNVRVVPIPEDPVGAARGSSKGLGEALLRERQRERAQR